ncbi:MAG: hypothetical protein C4575_10615 [Desulforudis sp.]|nr:MAG: hypothetical protein C4575_10615 [Desulforudis sp.]
MESNFSIHYGQNVIKLSQNDINEYAELYKLNRISKDRFSSLFVINLMLLEKVTKIDPMEVVEEIMVLEGMRHSSQTKTESEFRGGLLKGLWHKHFMPSLPSTIAYNITNNLGKHGISNLVEKIFDPKKSPIITKEMIEELSHQLIVGSMEERAEKEKLTGEWIVYAKENKYNYYLGIWKHDSGDENIAETIRSTCMPQFQFLSKYFP